MSKWDQAAAKSFRKVSTKSSGIPIYEKLNSDRKHKMLKKYLLPSPHSPSPIYREPVHRRFIRLLTTEIDAQKSTNLISIQACFLTSFTSASSFSACFAWCNSQTGNVVN